MADMYTSSHFFNLFQIPMTNDRLKLLIQEKYTTYREKAYEYTDLHSKE